MKVKIKNNVIEASCKLRNYCFNPYDIFLIRASQCCDHKAIVIEYEDNSTYWTAFRVVLCLKHSVLDNEIISLLGADPVRLYVFYSPTKGNECISCGQDSDKAFCPICRTRLFVSIFEHRKQLIRDANEIQKTSS